MVGVFSSTDHVLRVRIGCQIMLRGTKKKVPLVGTKLCTLFLNISWPIMITWELWDLKFLRDKTPHFAVKFSSECYSTNFVLIFRHKNDYSRFSIQGTLWEAGFAIWVPYILVSKWKILVRDCCKFEKRVNKGFFRNKSFQKS